MPEDDMRRLLASAGLAFSGTVQAVGQSAEPGTAPDERTVTVAVEDALRAPDDLDLGPGAQVTVRLSADRPPLNVGDQAVFFADAAIFGDGLVVDEVGRADVPATGRVLSGGGDLDVPVRAAEGLLADIAHEDLVAHASEADAIVRARVVGLREAPIDKHPAEHDPLWWIATFEADVVAKGDIPGGGAEPVMVEALYANSLDVRWRRSPKPKAGQGGLWLLHRAADDLAELAPFQLVHPEDLQPSVLLDDLRDRGIARPA